MSAFDEAWTVLKMSHLTSEEETLLNNMREHTRIGGKRRDLNAAVNHQIPPGLWAELATQKDKFESQRPMMPYTEEDVMNVLRNIKDNEELPNVPTEVLQYLDRGQLPEDRYQLPEEGQ